MVDQHKLHYPSKNDMSPSREYQDLLKDLTEYQHNILIDLGMLYIYSLRNSEFVLWFFEYHLNNFRELVKDSIDLFKLSVSNIFLDFTQHQTTWYTH